MGIQINGLTDIISATDGSLTVSGADLSNLTQLNVTGVATFQGNVSIAGTLTYDDVTNVDSLGIVTARKGIRITNNTAAGAAGTISSPADNVLAFGTNDVERVRIGAGGSVGIGTNDPIKIVHIRDTSSGNLKTGLYLENQGTANDTSISIDFDVNEGTQDFPCGRIAAIRTGNTNCPTDLLFSVRDGSNNTLTERVRVSSSGNLGVGLTNPTSKLEVQGDVRVVGVITATSDVKIGTKSVATTGKAIAMAMVFS